MKTYLIMIVKIQWKIKNKHISNVYKIISKKSILKKNT